MRLYPRTPWADEVKNLSWDDLNLVFALTHAMEIRAVVDNGDDALRPALESWQPNACNDRASPRRGRLNRRHHLTTV